VSGRAAVFLDRDGVLNEFVRDPESRLPDSPLRARDVRMVPGAAAAAARLAQAGFALVCVTNQPSAAKGKASVEELLDVHRRVVELLAREGVRIEASRLCWHHPEGVVPGLTQACACRKPEPGMLLDAAGALSIDLGRSWMVGDTDRDVAAGRAAGCRTVLLDYPDTADKRSPGIAPDLHAGDLDDGVTQILSLVKSETFRQTALC
jgi:D-glycero-D-manno-heptose 1,7-bisphosphate phosphatase